MLGISKRHQIKLLEPTPTKQEMSLHASDNKGVEPVAKGCWGCWLPKYSFRESFGQGHGREIYRELLSTHPPQELPDPENSLKPKDY